MVKRNFFFCEKLAFGNGRISKKEEGAFRAYQEDNFGNGIMADQAYDETGNLYISACSSEGMLRQESIKGCLPYTVIDSSFGSLDQEKYCTHRSNQYTNLPILYEDNKLIYIEPTEKQIELTPSPDTGAKKSGLNFWLNEKWVRYNVSEYILEELSLENESYINSRAYVLGATYGLFMSHCGMGITPSPLGEHFSII